MNSATIILWCIAGVLLIFSWKEGSNTVKRGGTLAWETTKQNALLILLAFIIVGFVNVLSPDKYVKAWIGPNTGLIGILLAEIIGMFLPGGPYVVFPLIAILFEAGAGIAPVITLITSWATQSILTISFELPFMGWRFSVLRWGIGLAIPLTAGIVTILLWG
ncbi:MAG: permease [Anaerolineales bacterium]|nr:permease [Anaerolineales bacterium]